MNDFLNLSKKPELLAPAGTYECFECAIKAGADAVYLAGDKYGARAYAGNFNQEELLKALDYAHLFGKKIFLTVNTVFKDEEIKELYSYIRPYYEAGLDAVIVQDIGVIKYLKSCFADIKVHVSTQASITDAEGVMLLKQYGADRIVLARELSLNEIRSIYDKTKMPLECFIHGAMCYCYSGKCLFSSFLGGRSGNRGRCAQPCRLSFNDKYPLSMKDMYTLRSLPSLIDAGIASFKIEGRMKSPDYVSAVTGVYRKYIDMYYDDPSCYKVDEADEKLLLDLYTRSGNCGGYYNKYNGADMITIDFPGYNGKKEHAEYTNEYNLKAETKLPVKGTVRLNAGENAELTLTYKDKKITYSSDIVEKAEKSPTTEETIRRQLLKTGADVFEFSSLTVMMTDDIFIPVSKLNSLRREAFLALRESILSDYYRSVPCEAFDLNSLEEYKEKQPDDFRSFIISAEGQSLSAVAAILSSSYAVRIIVPLCLLLDLKSGRRINEALELSLNEAEKSEKEVYIKLPYVLRSLSNLQIKSISKLLLCDFVKGVYADNYEALGLLLRLKFQKHVVSDMHLYCTSAFAAKALADLGVHATTVPVELNKKELLKRNIANEDMIVYGRIPLMLSAQCVRKTLSGCTKKEGYFYINDRKNISFPVFCNCTECLNVIYNSVPVFIKKEDDIIKSLKPSSLRLIFTDEKEEDILNILKYYAGDGEIGKFEHTLGHLKRGVE